MSKFMFPEVRKRLKAKFVFWLASLVTIFHHHLQHRGTIPGCGAPGVENQPPPHNKFLDPPLDTDNGSWVISLTNFNKNFVTGLLIGHPKLP